MFKSAKQQRALRFLQMRTVKTVQQIAEELDIPFSTIYKHEVALNRLLGYQGSYVKSDAVNCVKRVVEHKWTQVDAANASVYSDHKMVSDLVAMSKALEEHREDLQRAFAMESEVEPEQTQEEKFKDSFDQVALSVKELIELAPSQMTEELHLHLVNLSYAVSMLEKQL